MNKKLWATISRIGINLFPPIRGGGGRVVYIAEDFMRLTVRLKLTWRTRNIVGTIFGGSMYASTDPFYMIMLREILGKEFVVWDKGCTIRFKRPAKETIYAKFVITEDMLNQVTTQVAEKGEYTFTWPLAYKNKDESVVYCEFDKVMYVATKAFYKEKLAQRAQSINRD